MSKFQTIFLGIFVFFIIVGVIIFAGVKGGGGKEAPRISIWGLIRQDIFEKFLSELNLTLPQALNISYVEKSPAKFEREFVEALAVGKGPDAVLIPQDFILKEEDKLLAIPYSVMPERTFKDTFIEEGELYLSPAGVLGIPFAVDPLVMYWNRDIFSGSAVARSPSSWEELAGLVPKLVNKDNASNVYGAAVGLGEIRNVNHGKEILSALLLQAGNPIVTRESDGKAVSTLGLSVAPVDSVLKFFTEFSNPTSPSYTWNRALPSSKNFFLSGDLAVYFGPASEVRELRAKNPQLNFDVSLFPQPKANKNKLTFGTLYAFAIPRNSTIANEAYNVISTLTGAPALSIWTRETYLPPVRRDLLSEGTPDPYLSVFYTSAIMARGWLDPDSAETRNLFQGMVESVISGRERPTEAAQRVSAEIYNLINK